MTSTPPNEPTTMAEEADEPTQEALAAQRETVGDEPRLGEDETHP